MQIIIVGERQYIVCVHDITYLHIDNPQEVERVKMKKKEIAQLQIN